MRRSVKTPPGEDRERRVCDGCGFIDYVNPRIVAGVVAHREGKILLCRRAIEPRMGFWTLPAGFMELGETTSQGAARETSEELGKTAGKDAKAGKATYPSILGMKRAEIEASRYTSEAIKALKPLGNRGFRLLQLANFLLNRQN